MDKNPAGCEISAQMDARLVTMFSNRRRVPGQNLIILKETPMVTQLAAQLAAAIEIGTI